LILGGMPARERVRWRHANWGNARQISFPWAEEGAKNTTHDSDSGSPEKRVGCACPLCAQRDRTRGGL
jgi:hypothetical protein